jgi:hypothetical protein
MPAGHAPDPILSGRKRVERHWGGVPDFFFSPARIRILDSVFPRYRNC